MKNNLVRLLGVAFAVAIVSTALFYFFVVARLAPASPAGRSMVVAARRITPGALIGESDIRMAAIPGTAAVSGSLASPSLAAGQYALAAFEAGEPITQSRIAPPDSRQAAGARVPAGMRAISVQVADSSGVVSLLRPGNRVDVYAVGERSRQRGEPELRTVLQNIEVLAVGGDADAHQARNGVPVVTLLARPQEAEILALAESGGRVRLVLRNSSDEETNPSHKLAFSKVFDRGVAASPASPVQKAAALRPVPRTEPLSNVLLRVRLLGAPPSVLDELNPKLSLPRQAGTMQVSAFRPGADLESTLDRLLEDEKAQLLSATRLLFVGKREVSFDAAAEDRGTELACSLRIMLTATRERNKWRLRVVPEFRMPSQNGEAVRRIETDVELGEGQSCLLSGLLPSSENKLLEWLFPGWKVAGPRELVVIVTPETGGPVQTAAAR